MLRSGYLIKRLYHVTSRGDRRETIYEDDADRMQFLETLETVIRDFTTSSRASYRDYELGTRTNGTSAVRIEPSRNRGLPPSIKRLTIDA